MRADEMEGPSPSQLDFVPRERRNESFRITTACLLIIGATLLFGYVPGLREIALAPAVIALLIGLLCMHIVPRYQRNLDLVMFTEFQNLIFSQSLALGSSFCAVAKRDGSIFYANEGLKRTFGSGGYGDTQAFSDILERSNVALADRERILGAIYNNIPDRVIFPLATGSDTKKTFILTLDPLARPGGYVLVRGREFKDPRTGAALMPEMLRATSVDKLGHLLGFTPIAHYATDAFGRFEYVNKAFEDSLGYAHSDILATRLNLTSVLFELGGKTISSDYQLADYKGPAVLQRKGGGTVEATIMQTVIRDEKGKIAGATGTILLDTPRGK